MSEAKSLKKHPIHLGLEASAEAQPEFSGLPWYQAYAERAEKDGKEGRLVALHSFSSDWDSWEMHPVGSEVVICVEGEMTLVQLRGEEEHSVELAKGEYAINPPGVWHTANVKESATAVFITAGMGTQHKPR